MYRFIAGTIFGVWLAQNYSLPDVGQEFEKIKKKYLKPRKED